LLVAVILISTVIVTYSIIRNSPVSGQPPVQNAIDEINLAIRQVLGFTVGYYGSILRVTGNSSYAKMLATNYLQSGLVHIANVHPEWATSLEMGSSNLYACWFADTSYSGGDLTVAYNLTGLGISGMNYTASCKLSIGITNPKNNQACLNVTKDADEPLVNLGKQNFKFFLYENSTWKLTIPSTVPAVYGNGTYLIDPPTGIDVNSYVIQVEDQRGIIVVASSFTSYIVNLTWPSASPTTYYYLDNSTSDVDSSPDKGTHSNFTAQQYADGIFDTLTEASDGVPPNYQLDLEEQWKNVNYTNSDGKYLCIKAGTLGTETIKVDAWNGSAWISVLSNLTANNWNNASVSSLLKSSTFTIRFKGSNEASDSIQDSWQIDATILRFGEANRSLSSARDTIAVELLQNGTMRWLGQSLQLTTQPKPIPPLPIKSIHLNQTINGVNCEVPFQTEDWASDYLIPMGLTSNSSVFGERTMLVFLANNNVSKATIWWNGSDVAIQTPYAYVNRYFTGDNPSIGRLTNGKLTLQFGSGFTLTSSIGGTSCKATFMRINTQASVYGSSLAYVITSGIVRDIVHQEAEWTNGVTNCPNLYSHIVLTLPANVTYYTYQLRVMFVNSEQNRSIADLCPIKLETSIYQAQTENGTTNGYPRISAASGLFYNQSTIWAHHWSQFISGTKGAGIMFTDNANYQLYVFDDLAGSKTGALKTNSATGTIELLPVTMTPLTFRNALDTIWCGAVSTFSNTTPIYQETNGEASGSWINVEYPPTVAVNTSN
jgi:hypothetical protein